MRQRVIKFEERAPSRYPKIEPTLKEQAILDKYLPKKYRPKGQKDPLSDWKSAWLITINTNQNNPNLIEPLRIVWQYIVDHIEFFCWGRGFITGKPLETNRVIELGSKFHRLHLHTKLEITTKGFANLDYVKIQNFINMQLRQIPSFKGVYFNAKLIKNYNQAMLIKEYLEKGPYQEESKQHGFKII